MVWKKYKSVVFEKVFVPFLILFGSCLVKYCFFIGNTYTDVYWTIMNWTLNFLICVNSIIFGLLEVLQLI